MSKQRVIAIEYWQQWLDSIERSIHRSMDSALRDKIAVELARREVPDEV